MITYLFLLWIVQSLKVEKLLRASRRKTGGVGLAPTRLVRSLNEPLTFKNVSGCMSMTIQSPIRNVIIRRSITLSLCFYMARRIKSCGGQYGETKQKNNSMDHGINLRNWNGRFLRIDSLDMEP